MNFWRNTAFAGTFLALAGAAYFSSEYSSTKPKTETTTNPLENKVQKRIYGRKGGKFELVFEVPLKKDSHTYVTIHVNGFERYQIEWDNGDLDSGTCKLIIDTSEETYTPGKNELEIRVKDSGNPPEKLELILEGPEVRI